MYFEFFILVTKSQYTVFSVGQICQKIICLIAIFSFPLRNIPFFYKLIMEFIHRFRNAKINISIHINIFLVDIYSKNTKYD